MSNKNNRSKRLRKKLYVGEFSILGFEFSCNINLDSVSDYEGFFDQFADMAHNQNLFVSLEAVDDHFEGFATSGERYDSATDEDRKIIEKTLNDSSIVSNVVVGELIDAHHP
jgi:uncharacterized protein YggL (DUF469 family)